MFSIVNWIYLSEKLAIVRRSSFVSPLLAVFFKKKGNRGILIEPSRI